jgi:UDP-N-acetylmuramoylalanine--D-glutamate ligase
VVGEIEVALHFLGDTRYIAVTGTNGKTTTTALIGHLLRALGPPRVDAGKHRAPALRSGAHGGPAGVGGARALVLPACTDTPSLDPAVGVVTNLSPDHLDRYPSLDAYYGDKARLFANAGAESRWVLNGDDAEVLALHGKVGLDALPGETLTFSLRDAAAPAHFDRAGDALVLDGAALLPRAELPLLGDHNVANALAAALAVWPPTRSTARHPRARAWPTRSARSARSPPHGAGGDVRRRRVDQRQQGDERQLDARCARGDAAAVRAPPWWPAQGRVVRDARRAVRRHGRAVLAYGEAAPISSRTSAVSCGGAAGSVLRGGRRPRARAGPPREGGAVLSAACSSFDMFNNYEERGAEFRRARRRARRSGRWARRAGTTIWHVLHVRPPRATPRPPAPRSTCASGGAWDRGARPRGLVAILLAFGLAVLYSASAIVAMRGALVERVLPAAPAHRRGAGRVAFAAFAKIDAERWHGGRGRSWGSSILGMLLTVLPFTEGIAPRINGSRRFLLGARCSRASSRSWRSSSGRRCCS